MAFCNDNETADIKVFNIQNEVVTAFIDEVMYPNDDYSFTKITDYIAWKTDYKKDLPRPVVIEVPDEIDDGEALVVKTFCDNQEVRSDTFDVEQTSLEIWNLIPNKKYLYRLYLLDSDDQGECLDSAFFRTEGRVRMLNIDSIHNCRDIGGWPLPNGKHVKYDRVFRSSELAWSRPHITAKGIYELLKVQGIAVEIDFGDFSDESPIADRIEFVSGEDFQILPYQEMLTKTRAQYKNCFEKTLSSLREGKKVLFHCTLGADRTGTFAFLLEGLLGVSENDLAKEYELTSLVYDERYRSIDYSWMMDDINRLYSGNTLNERIEKMALGFGISQEDIEEFRGLMTEDDETENPTRLEGILDSANREQDITVYTISGQMAAKVRQADLDYVLNRLPKGMYFVNQKKILK